MTGALHAEAMAWLRFGKRLPVVTTEVGRWNADVLGMNRSTAIEVEVKVSLSDLQAEFRNKTTKHWTYDHGLGGHQIPNFFYFCVPAELKEKALAVIEEKAPKAGLLLYTGDTLLPGRNLDLARKAQRLTSAKPSSAAIRAAILRMGSQLCGLNIIQAQLERKLAAAIAEVGRSSLAAASALPDAADVAPESVDGLDL